MCPKQIGGSVVRAEVRRIDARKLLLCEVQVSP